MLGLFLKNSTDSRVPPVSLIAKNKKIEIFMGDFGCHANGVQRPFLPHKGTGQCFTASRFSIQNGQIDAGT